ncbi:MAG: ribonuclease R [Firmicutes bacterium HGW-Firmicutes-10]|nr:MAG: ribonuclease R [Firmicutes bacterium HGW-Firmicutes-10]
MDLRLKIIDLLESREVSPMTIVEWAEHLGMTEDEKYVELEQTLNKLEDDVVLVRSKKERYLLAEDAGVKKGVLSINPKGFGFVSVEEGDDVYIPMDGIETAMSGDEVVVRVFQRQNGTSDGEIIRILKRNTFQILGTIRFIKKKLTFVAQDVRLGFVRFAHSPKLKLVEGHVVLAKILKYERPMLVEGVEILGHVNDPGVDILAVLMEYNIFPKFPQEALDMANSVNKEVVIEEGRLDLTDKLTITIDGEDAKDLDDAITIEKIGDKYRLGVHIADVSYYVKENSPLDHEAFERGTSVYVVDRVVPMLPHVLSNGICSLNPNEKRYALSCIMDVEPNGEVSDYQLTASMIESDFRMTYTEVNKMIHGDEETKNKYPALIEMVDQMFDCSTRIRTRREGLGAIDFEMEEAKILVDEQGHISQILKRERFEAEKLIEDFMVSANEVVAKHTKWSHVPSLYRIHEVPSKKKMQAYAKIVGLLGYKMKGSMDAVKPIALQKIMEHFKGHDEFPVVSRMMLRSMQKAKYDPSPVGHFGLGLEDYTHFTSPIRRYPDLVVHRMLRKYVFGTPDIAKMAVDEERLKEIAEQSSFKERNAVDAEREIENMKKAEYMEEHIGMIADGVISGVTKFGFFVELENTIEGLVHIQSLEDDYYEFDAASMRLTGKNTRKEFRLGQKVRIKVKGANKAQRTVDFTYLPARKPRK